MLVVAERKKDEIQQHKRGGKKEQKTITVDEAECKEKRSARR